MDRLSAFFSHFSLTARVFFSGRLCGVSGDHASDSAGHLHVLRGGVLEVQPAGGLPFLISQPSVLFYPRPFRHRFRADEASGAELVCASIEFGTGMLNPLMRSLPEVLVFPLAGEKELGTAVDLFFAEAFSENAARQTAVDRLAEYVLILLLRAAMAEGLMTGGILMGLADPQLSKAIEAMHQRPEEAWTLETLAEQAGMSRARFAVRFREVVGMTPFDYLADWRVGLAQTMLKRGQALKIVAPSVGYAGSASLSRAFTERVGMPVTEWLKRNVG